MAKDSEGNQTGQIEDSFPSDECDAYTTAELEAIVDGRTTEAEEEELSAHLAECGFCRVRLDELLLRLIEMTSSTLVRQDIARSVDDLEVVRSRLHPVYPRFRILGPGDCIGRFEISKVLGKGGTSIVYECLDPRMGRRVAVKLLHRNAFDATNLARLEREAYSLARLDHPGIVRAYEVYPMHDPPFIVLEMVGGGTAHDLLKKGPLPYREAARLIAEVAKAVHQAHEHGILHRDIKPSNLLIDDSPRFESSEAIQPIRLKISDFGLARPLKESSELTTTGAIMGTPAYMSPEQTQGRESAIGAASDIYSLGVVLYEFLIGRPPLVADSALRTMQRVQDEEPLPPLSILGSIPADLDTICMKCLRKKPEERYRTALDLAGDLTRFLQGKTIVARPVGKIEKTGRWIKRNRSLSAALAWSAILAIGLIVLTVRFAIVQNKLRIEADANAATARLNADRFEATAKDLLIESDRTRNFMFTGIQNLDGIARQLSEVQNHADAVRLSEKAKSLNADAVRRYVSRLGTAQGNPRGEKIDMIFRDGRNLIVLGMKDIGIEQFDRIMKLALASRPDDPDHYRLQKYGMLIALIMADEIATHEKPDEALRNLYEAWINLAFPEDLSEVDREFLYVRKMLLDRLLELAKTFEAAAERISAGDRADIEAEAGQISKLLELGNP